MQINGMLKDKSDKKIEPEVLTRHDTYTCHNMCNNNCK